MTNSLGTTTTGASLYHQREHIKNKIVHDFSRAANRGANLGTGLLAARCIGPVSVETDHAPLDSPGGADDAGVLADRVVDPAHGAVVDVDLSAAETPWNCGVVPGH